MKARRAVRKGARTAARWRRLHVCRNPVALPDDLGQRPGGCAALDCRQDDPNLSPERLPRPPPGAPRSRRMTPPHRSVADVLGITPKAGAPITSTKSAPSQRTRRSRSRAFGGQGVLLLGQLLIEMGMREGLEVSWLPSYGPEMRSGSAHCHVCLSKERIGTPLISHPDVLVAMNEFSLRKFAHEVVSGGVILYNGASVPADFSAGCAGGRDSSGGNRRQTRFDQSHQHRDDGRLLEETECLAPGTALSVLEDKVKKLTCWKSTARHSPPAVCLSTNRRTSEPSVNPTASLSIRQVEASPRWLDVEPGVHRPIPGQGGIK
jgi:hypothetical protein